MTTALVTGITGQDGTYLTEALLARGHSVHGYVRADDDAAADFASEYPEVTLHRGEVDDPATVRATLEATGPDEVYHLAGISSVALSWDRPLAVQQVNAVGTGVLLQTRTVTLQPRLWRAIQPARSNQAGASGRSPSKVGGVRCAGRPRGRSQHSRLRASMIAAQKAEASRNKNASGGAHVV